MRVKAGIITAGLAAAAMILGLVAPAGALSPAPNEHLVLSFTSFSNGKLVGTAVASGQVDGTGTVVAGEGNVFKATVTLPQGKLKLKVTSGPSQDTINNNTCAVAFRGTDTMVVTGGTGVFAGASGSGSDRAYGGLIFPRNPDGTCDLNGTPKVGITVIVDLHI